MKYDEQDNLVSADRDDPDAFIETIGVETVYPQQLSFVKPAEETIGIRGQLFAVLETLPEDNLAQIKDFAFSNRNPRSRKIPLKQSLIFLDVQSAIATNYGAQIQTLLQPIVPL